MADKANTTELRKRSTATAGCDTDVSRNNWLVVMDPKGWGNLITRETHTRDYSTWPILYGGRVYEVADCFLHMSRADYPQSTYERLTNV